MADITITAANVVAGSDAVIRRGQSGATITAGQAVAVDASTGSFILADNNSATATVRQAVGIALNGASSGQPLAVLTGGSITIGGTMTAGVAYYLGDTPGGICPVADVGSGEYSCLIGLSSSTTVLKVQPLYSGVSL